MAEVKTVMPAAVIHGEHRPVGDYHGDIPHTHDMHADGQPAGTGGERT
jgi:hypothetical protein